MDETTAFYLLQAQMGAAWETAKGNLRAAVRIKGHGRLLGKMDELGRTPGWKDASDAIEKFIKDVEDNEWFD